MATHPHNGSEQAGREKKVHDLVLELDVMAHGQGFDLFSAQMVEIAEGLTDEQWQVLAENATVRRRRHGDHNRCHAPSDITVGHVLRVYRDRLEASTSQKAARLIELQVPPQGSAMNEDELLPLSGEERAICRDIDEQRVMRSFDDAKMRGEP